VRKAAKLIKKSVTPSAAILCLVRSTYSNFTTLSAVTFIPRVPYFITNSHSLLEKNVSPMTAPTGMETTCIRLLWDSSSHQLVKRFSTL